MANTATRPTREEQERFERLRRDGGTLDRTDRLTLHIPQAVRDENAGYNFRWINDTGNRMYQKTELDVWSKVEGVDPITVDVDKEGKPIKAHLCKKHQDFSAADAAAKEANLREQERGMIQGERDAAAKADLPDNVAYTPGRNTISRGISKS